MSKIKNLAEQSIDDAIEAAYWQFDAMRKGILEWKMSPKSERDAFKLVCWGLSRGIFLVPRELLGRGIIWTTDKPKKPGYWWYRSRRGTVEFVVYIYQGNAGLMIELPGGEIKTPNEFAGECGQWAGPIEPPTEG